MALQTAEWLLRSPRVMDRCRARYGDVFTIDLHARAVAGPGAKADEGRWVFLADPAHVQALLRCDPALVRTGETNGFLEWLVGPRSILVLDEPKHMRERKLMLPPLHGERVARYAELIERVTLAELSRWPVGEPFALWPRTRSITLEVILEAVFGVRETGRHARLHRLLQTMLDTMTSRRWLVRQGLHAARGRRRGAGPSRSARALIDPLDEFLYEEIAARRGTSDLEGRDDILSTLMLARREDGSALDDAELRDELVTLLIAGHESTATALAWAFERLLRHPDALGRLRREAEEGGVEYADAVVKETLRLRPVLPFVLRKLAEPLEVGGYPLPAGTWVAPCGYLIHRRPDVYPQPLSFRPERFLERAAGTYTWMPFGGGVRRCLGASFAQLEMRVVLQTVLANAELEPTDLRPEPVRPRFITFAPGHGARVRLTGRRPPAGSTAAGSPIPRGAGG